MVEKNNKLSYLRKIKLKKNKRAILILLIIVFVIIIFLSSFSLGKSLSNMELGGTLKIAEPIIEIENGKEIDITSVNNTGNYEFKIKNYDNEGNITNVNIQYYIEILSKLDESINIKIYKGNQEMQMNNNRTEIVQLGNTSKEEHIYRLEITYDKNKSNSIEDILQDIQIKVHSEQVKV